MNMKNKKAIKPVARTCQTCEFDSKDMCIIHGAGYKSREEKNTCNDWSISPDSLVFRKKRSEKNV